MTGSQKPRKSTLFCSFFPSHNAQFPFSAGDKLYYPWFFTGRFRPWPFAIHRHERIGLFRFKGCSRYRLLCRTFVCKLLRKSRSGRATTVLTATAARDITDVRGFVNGAGIRCLNTRTLASSLLAPALVRWDLSAGCAWLSNKRLVLTNFLLLYWRQRFERWGRI